MQVHRLHPGDRVADHVDQACVRDNLCHPLRDAAVDVGPRVARGALADRRGPSGAVEQRLVPAKAARPVLLGHEEVRLAELPAAPEEDIRMLIKVMTKAHGPCLHRPDHHKSWQGRRRTSHGRGNVTQVTPAPSVTARSGPQPPPRRCPLPAADPLLKFLPLCANSIAATSMSYRSADSAKKHP